MNDLKDRIIECNKAYRVGNPIISDAEYDILLNKLQGQMDWFAFIDFKQSLVEESGDVKFDYVIGSLDKVKSDEPEKFWKWVKKNRIAKLFFSAKIDGCSFVAEYRNGNLVRVSSRGDGSEGTDWTDKAMCIPSIPKTIDYTSPLDVRGEFSLTGNDHEVLGYKNRRNGTVGIMNRDDVRPDSLKYIKAYGYQILNSEECICDQFYQMERLGFLYPDYALLMLENMDSLDELIELYEKCKQNAEYDIDGLVISDVDWKNENDKFFPEGKVAFKVNSEGVQTTVLDVKWELSKNRYLKPVLVVSPVDIDGSTVSRVTAYNAQYITACGIGKGAVIKIVKSGQVIPKIVDVVSSVEHDIPNFCPECESNLEWNGVELQCPNTDCGEIKRIESFIKSIGIENVSEKRLSEFGIYTFDELLRWKPYVKYKSQMDFYDQLISKVFHNSPKNILRSFSYNGFGSTLFDSLYDSLPGNESYRLNDMRTIFLFPERFSLPSGIGIRTIEKASHDFKKNWNILRNIMDDDRYVLPENVETETPVEIKQGALTGKSVLFTGKFKEPRSKCEQQAMEYGAKLANSVSKDLDILFCAPDKWGTSSKFKKAEKLGITIMTEDDFWKMIK